jgi:hypothetical protein
VEDARQNGLSWPSTPYRDIPKSLQDAVGICNNCPSSEFFGPLSV